MVVVVVVVVMVTNLFRILTAWHSISRWSLQLNCILVECCCSFSWGVFVLFSTLLVYSAVAWLQLQGDCPSVCLSFCQWQATVFAEWHLPREIDNRKGENILQKSREMHFFSGFWKRSEGLFSRVTFPLLVLFWIEHFELNFPLYFSFFLSFFLFFSFFFFFGDFVLWLWNLRLLL